MRSRRPGVWAFVAAGLVVVAALAVFVSPHASSQPDGLNKVAIDQGFDRHERAGATADGPTAGYAVKGVDDAGLSTGLAGLIGVAATFLLGTGVVLVARRLSRRRVATAGSEEARVIDRYVAGDTLVHRLAPEAKVVATFVFVVAVVATPSHAVWAFALHAAVVGTVVAAARVPGRTLRRGLRIELPFVAFAVLLPVLGGAPRVDVAGLSLSQTGLWGAFAILVKGTLGVVASVVLAVTTSPADLVRALERLHVPRALVAITGFMVRYLAILAGEAERMRIARQSRGYEPRWLWQAGAMGASVGTLFVRSYERGERVHLAMCSRGYDGTMPDLAGRKASGRDWSIALLPALVSVLVATIAVATT